ncbi:MAG: potassium-transporting ATPase subunit KdpB [Draconibacterium sp.]|nr:potassium-transporting ATPase subunit KdpB [Draconibacterium sp.]
MSTKQNTNSLFNKKILIQAAKDSVFKLNPVMLIKNPVIFIVAIGSLLTTVVVISDIVNNSFSSFNFQIAIWLWFTVLFANFSEAIPEGRAKALTESLRNNRTQTTASKVEWSQEVSVYATELKKGDTVVCESGDIIPSDGEVIEGIASVDESAITGESAPVIRESGGDRSAVTGGTKVISDRILIQITSEPGNTFIDRMIALVEGAKRQKTPNEIALSILLSGLSIIFLLAVVTLPAFFGYSLSASGLPMSQNLTLPVLIALLVCLIPTTIGGLLSAIGISGMDRLLQRNVMATDFIPAEGVKNEELADAAQLSSLSDETPEGRSIVILAKEKFNIRGREVHQLNATFIPFTAQTRMSGVDFKTADGKLHQIRKGASEAIRTFVQTNNGFYPQKIQDIVSDLARQGATPLVVAEDNRVLGVIHLKDIVKGGIKQRFAELRKMGIKTVMITGDNSLTAAAIAAEAGVDDFMAEATPEDKLRRIREEQANGHLVGMIGDGTNDAPALAQADIGIAMNSGTQAAREAGNMVDLDSNPTKLIEVVEVGKQLLMTRGSLTTFSIANDVAKYFAIMPAIAISLYSGGSGVGPLSALNIMNLGSPQSAILSAVIFNALIIILLVPLALKGVRYRPVSANNALIRNLLIFGVGGLIAPFAGIKLIDVLINL